MNRHISEQYGTALENLRLRLLAMGGLVEQQLRKAVRAFTLHDSALAEEARAIDDAVNRSEVAIDDECIAVIALRQPAASDLRLLVRIMKAGTDLERVGDEAGRIAKAALAVAALPPPEDQHAEILQLFELAAAMLSLALDAFARLDVDAAYAVIAADAEVDDAYNAIIRNASGAVGRTPELWLNTMWAARALERVGDHAKNLCEHVVYAVEGRDVRHGRSMEAH